jgi:hypothetical protein
VPIFTPVPTAFAAARAASVTGSPPLASAAGEGAEGSGTGLSFGAVAAAGRGRFAAGRGFAAAARRGFGAGVPDASERVAAFSAASAGRPAAGVAASGVSPARFALRRPGLDRGRFPSTPLSSLIGAQSRVTGSNGPSSPVRAETGAGCNVTGYVYPLGGFGVEPTWLTG